MNEDLFDIQRSADGWNEQLSSGALLMHGRLVDHAAAVLDCLPVILTHSPFRHLYTPGGKRMSVAMTNCGQMGWVSDSQGYRYQAYDPLSNKPWPPMPALFHRLAIRAASEAGYRAFRPDVCLINCYRPGAQLSLHQDRDERAPGAPIVSFSLGLPATFLWGGMHRADPVSRHQLRHGDVLVWGGPDRFRFHGVAPLKEGQHPQLAARRINLTFRETGLHGALNQPSAPAP